MDDHRWYDDLFQNNYKQMLIEACKELDKLRFKFDNSGGSNPESLDGATLGAWWEAEKNKCKVCKGTGYIYIIHRGLKTEQGTFCSCEVGQMRKEGHIKIMKARGV